MSDQVQSAVTDRLNDRLAPLAAPDRLIALREALPGRIVFTTSFGIEDQAITRMIAEAGLDIEFATLDTGRMFPETYEVWQKTEDLYGVKIAPFYPDGAALETLIATQGINGFYNSVDARKACCGIRKVEPLARALNGADGWIAGLRADQSDHRGALAFVTHDDARNLIKLSPIFDWTRERVADYCERYGVPVNALHARGFLSIGCAPCTRAILPGEPERAGRWWWEREDKKECGLHVAPDGRLARSAGAA
jgi:phosphoadenosine phosphosulfate reductase